MKSDDLQIGDKIKIRDGSEYFIKNQEDLNHEIKVHDEKLLHCAMSSFGEEYKNCRYDIIKVQRYVPINLYGWNDETDTNRTSINGEKGFILKTIYERKEILDDKEKEWLGNFIKSTKMKNVKIKKWLGSSCKNEYLQIIYEIFNWEYKTLKSEVLYLPIFKKNTMYKGMELNKEYNLEELGL